MGNREPERRVQSNVELHVTEYVNGSDRVRYEYAGSAGTSDWTHDDGGPDRAPVP